MPSTNERQRSCPSKAVRAVYRRGVRHRARARARRPARARSRRRSLKVGGTGALAGTGKHAYAAELIERYQSRFGAVGEGLTTEQLYLGGRYLGRSVNLKGSVRLDVVEGVPATPTAIYDFKLTVNPNPTLSPSRIANIRAQAGLPSSVPVEV